MSAPVLSAMPSTFPAGSTVEFSRTFSSYPPASYSSQLFLSGRDLLEIAASVSGTAFRYVLATAKTEDLRAGDYEWQIWVTETATGKRHLVEFSRVRIQPNIKTARAGELQTFAERQLLIIEAAIEGRLQKDQETFTIDGIEVRRIPIERLWELRGKCLSEIAAQRTAGSFGQELRARFSGVDSER